MPVEVSTLSIAIYLSFLIFFSETESESVSIFFVPLPLWLLLQFCLTPSYLLLASQFFFENKSLPPLYECVFSFIKHFWRFPSPLLTPFTLSILLQHNHLFFFQIFPMLKKRCPCQHENDHPHSTPASKTLPATFSFN